MDSRWIPVTKELPPDGQEVLTYSPSTPWWFSYDREHCAVVGFYSVAHGAWLFPTNSRNASIKPTHWMPLPEAPLSDSQKLDLIEQAVKDFRPSQGEKSDDETLAESVVKVVI